MDPCDVIATDFDEVPIKEYTEEEIGLRMEQKEHKLAEPGLIIRVEQRLNAIDDTWLWQYVLDAYCAQSYREGGLGDTIREIERMKP